MICERAKEQMAEHLSGALEPNANAKFLNHLEACQNCRREVRELDAVWRGLDILPSAEPSPALRARFTEGLAAYQCGLANKSARTSIRGFWFPQPVLAGLCAAALLAIGVAAGRYSGPERNEVSQLKGEMQSMRQLVTLSLLQQSSPGSRLRGVNYSYQMEKPDPQVQAALLFAVSHDPNVNVRLSALDALQKFSASPEVSQALIAALPNQDSPLVQVSLIDALVNANENNAAPALRDLVRNPQANSSVRQRAEWGLRKLGAA